MFVDTSWPSVSFTRARRSVRIDSNGNVFHGDDNIGRLIFIGDMNKPTPITTDGRDLGTCVTERTAVATLVHDFFTR